MSCDQIHYGPFVARVVQSSEGWFAGCPEFEIAAYSKTYTGLVRRFRERVDEYVNSATQGSRSPQYTQGYRAATKDAVTWLHNRADQMNDPHAKQILNGAAWNLGHDKSPRARDTGANDAT